MKYHGLAVYVTEHHNPCTGDAWQSTREAWAALSDDDRQVYIDLCMARAIPDSPSSLETVSNQAIVPSLPTTPDVCSNAFQDWETAQTVVPVGCVGDICQPCGSDECLPQMPLSEHVLRATLSGTSCKRVSGSWNSRMASKVREEVYNGPPDAPCCETRGYCLHGLADPRGMELKIKATLNNFNAFANSFTNGPKGTQSCGWPIFW